MKLDSSAAAQGERLRGVLSGGGGRSHGKAQESLTRGVPRFLGWLINPFVNSVPRETIEFNMGVVRDGVGKLRPF